MAKAFYRVLAMALSVFGFGCSGRNITNVEYGVPHVEYHVSGRVLSESSQPIPGISVHYGDEIILTGTWGAFDIRTGDASVNGPSYEPWHEPVCANVMPPHNGLYESECITPVLIMTRPPSGSWDKGKYEAMDLTIVLKEIADSMSIGCTDDLGR